MSDLKSGLILEEGESLVMENVFAAFYAINLILGQTCRKRKLNL